MAEGHVTSHVMAEDHVTSHVAKDHVTSHVLFFKIGVKCHLCSPLVETDGIY